MKSYPVLSIFAWCCRVAALVTVGATLLGAIANGTQDAALGGIILLVGSFGSGGLWAFGDYLEMSVRSSQNLHVMTECLYRMQKANQRGVKHVKPRG